VIGLLLSSVLGSTTLILGGLIVDGTGRAPFLGDVRIRGSRIIAVGKLRVMPNEAVLSAKGLVVAPGFIDAHSHALGGIAKDPLAVSQLTQGITTAVAGQDGGWDQPVRAEFSEIEKAKPAINFAMFSGHGGLRESVMGKDYKRPANEGEIDKMSKLLAQDMADGALGMSSGLEYDPGYYASTQELIDLARVAAKSGGMYISHVRDESDRAFEAFEELCKIGREAKIHVQISHIKLGTAAVWGRASEANRVGLKQGITADVYPYQYWQSTIAALTPSRDWENPEIWRRGLADVGGAKNVRLTRFSPDPTWEGKTIEELAQKQGKDPVAVIQDIVRRTTGDHADERQSVVVTAMTEDDLIQFIRSPRTMFCSDGAIGGSHPRGAGSFPRILGRYVRDLKAISLAVAIRKMTSLPAKTFKLPGRGRLAKSYVADIVIFDPNMIRDNATPKEPTRLSEGVKDVFVSGEQVLKGGKPTGKRSGRVLRRGEEPN
jgi:N-acyl-D-amino-acid deacylase